MPFILSFEWKRIKKNLREHFVVLTLQVTDFALQAILLDILSVRVNAITSVNGPDRALMTGNGVKFFRLSEGLNRWLWQPFWTRNIFKSNVVNVSQIYRLMNLLQQQAIQGNKKNKLVVSLCLGYWLDAWTFCFPPTFDSLILPLSLQIDKVCFAFNITTLSWHFKFNGT